MGVATDSFIQVVGIAGLVAVILLGYCLMTRLRSKPGSRGVFQRMPLLLPAAAFVIVTMLVLESGILPMSMYRGDNRRIYYGALYDDDMSYTVYDSGIIYTDYIQVQFQTGVYEGEYFLIHVDFINNGSIAESLDVNLTQTLLQETGNYVQNVNMDPGMYTIQINGTKYDEGVPDDSQYLTLTIHQPVQPTFIPEVVDWSSYQFFLFIGSMFFIIGGFCIGRVDRERTSEEEIDQEPPRGDEYIRPFH
jgi:hypothetical protein